MEKCRRVRDYAILLKKIRDNAAEGIPMEDAIDKAVTECIDENVLRDMLDEKGKHANHRV